MEYKYTKIVEWIKEKISQGELKPGKKLPTEAYLTKKFEVSRHTVRQALKQLEEEGAVYSVQGSGYYIKRILSANEGTVSDKKPASKVIGMLVANSGEYIFPEIIRGASEYLLEHGYLLHVAFTGGKLSQEKEIINRFMDANLAGVLIEPLSLTMFSTNDKIYRKMASHIPTLMMHSDESSVCHTIGLNDIEGSRMLTEYLLDQGHSKIGTIFAVDETTAYSRYSGFFDAMADRGIDHSDEYDIWTKRCQIDYLFSEGGNIALDKMLECVTAVVCHDDRIAYKLIQYIKERGYRVPEDFSVVGYDDSFYATLDMNFTSVTHPKERYGRNIAKAILDLINYPETFNPEKYIEQPKLVIRDSVMKITE